MYCKSNLSAYAIPQHCMIRTLCQKFSSYRCPSHFTRNWPLPAVFAPQAVQHANQRYELCVIRMLSPPYNDFLVHRRVGESVADPRCTFKHCSHVHSSSLSIPPFNVLARIEHCLHKSIQQGCIVRILIERYSCQGGHEQAEHVVDAIPQVSIDLCKATDACKTLVYDIFRD